MLKKIGYAFLILIALLLLAGTYAIKTFNNRWFQERPNYLTFETDQNPIQFNWGKSQYGDFIEPRSSIIIPLEIKTLPFKFIFQFDTGVPTTIVYENTLNSLRDIGFEFNIVVLDEKRYIDSLDFILGGKSISATMIAIKENYGPTFTSKDTSQSIKLGTLGNDIFSNRIAEIDFQNQSIQLYDERPRWMSELHKFTRFRHEGRIIMLPALLGEKEVELLYDSGSSAFGLITSKHRYDENTDPDTDEIKYLANSWGEKMAVYHKNTDHTFSIGGSTLSLKRMSYVDMYTKYQKFMTPFTRIGGWLVNLPFTESTMILDMQKEEFLVIDSRQ